MLVDPRSLVHHIPKHVALRTHVRSWLRGFLHNHGSPLVRHLSRSDDTREAHGELKGFGLNVSMGV